MANLWQTCGEEVTSWRKSCDAAFGLRGVDDRTFGASPARSRRADGTNKTHGTHGSHKSGGISRLWVAGVPAVEQPEQDVFCVIDGQRIVPLPGHDLHTGGANPRPKSLAHAGGFLHNGFEQQSLSNLPRRVWTARKLKDFLSQHRGKFLAVAEHYRRWGVG